MLAKPAAGDFELSDSLVSFFLRERLANFPTQFQRCKILMHRKTPTSVAARTE